MNQSPPSEQLGWSSPESLSAACSPVRHVTQRTHTPHRWMNAPLDSSSSAGYCPQCHGNRYPSVQSTSLNSYSIPAHHYSAPCGKDTCYISSQRLDEGGGGGDDDDDDSTYPILCDRDFYSLHRNVPALRRRDVDTVAIRTHFYPEGGWGWIVCGAGFLAHLLTSGLQLAFGLLYLYTTKHVAGKKGERKDYVMSTAWMGALCLCTSFFMSPLVVAICRRKSTRLLAVFGGLVMSLAFLFTSFSMQYHQALLSYGLFLGAGAGIVRETSGLILANYFRKRREFVEMVVQAGTGVGIALFSVLYKEAVGKLGWRFGLQAMTVLLVVGFFLGIVYRPASLYHPQRRAIQHLKNQRKKVKEKKTHKRTKKPPYFDFSPLNNGALRMLIASAATGAVGLYTPVFYLALQGFNEGLEDSALVILQTFLGFATALGCVGFGLIIIKPSTQCLISRQYLCQASMIGTGISLLALSSVQGYHGYVLFVCLYGVCLGGFMYSLKMFTLERVHFRQFTKAWSFVQGAESLPLVLGVPITGYINQTSPKAGYYFSFVFAMLGAILLTFVGYPSKKPGVSTSCSMNTNLTGDVAASPPRFNTNLSNTYKTSLPSLYNQFSRGSATPSSYTCNARCHPHRHSFKIYREPLYPTNYATISRRHSTCNQGDRLQKSSSYAAHINYHPSEPPPHYTNPTPKCCYQNGGGVCYRAPLRVSKSVPEGLEQWQGVHWRYGSCRRPRNVQVIEQITTSV